MLGCVWERFFPLTAYAFAVPAHAFIARQFRFSAALAARCGRPS